MSQEEAEKVDFVNFKTGVQEEVVVFDWEILNFENITKMKGLIKTQKVCIKSQNSKWHLRMVENLKKSNSSDCFIDIRCTLEQPTTEEPGSEIAQWMFVNNGYEEAALLTSNFFNNPFYNDQRVFPTEFIHGKETLVAFGNFSKIPLMENGSLKLMGRFTIYKGTDQHTSFSKYLSRGLEETSIVRLAQDMGNLLNSSSCNINSDVNICTEDEVIIPAHRAILSARSEYFASMFASGMQEQKTGEITVRGISGKAMKSLVHFLYSGTLDENWDKPDVIHDFTKAAHFYQVKEVVEFLDKNVGSICDLQSAGNLLIFCKRLEMKVAEKELRKLIRNNLLQTGKEDEFDDLLLSLASSVEINFN